MKVSEMLEEIKTDLDDVQRETILLYLEQAWLALGWIAWHSRRARDARGFSPPRVMSILADQAQDLRVAFKALGGQVPPDAPAWMFEPEDDR